MREPAPRAGGRPTETVTLVYGHRLEEGIINHPILPGSSVSGPACTIPRTILQVEFPPAASGRPSCAPDKTAARPKILVIDDADGF